MLIMLTVKKFLQNTYKYTQNDVNYSKYINKVSFNDLQYNKSVK